MLRYIYFLRWPPAAILDLIWLMLDHPRSVIASLSLILKFGLDLIYSFGDIVIFIFCCFRLKLLIHTHFWAVLGAYSPNMVTHRSIPQKDHTCVRKYVV